MKCPNCKFNNDDGALTCSKCGHPITLAERWDPSYRNLFLMLLAICFGLVCLNVLFSVF